MPKMIEEEILPRIYEFLNRIGIPFKETILKEPTFLPGLKIENGVLLVDRQKLKYKGDIIHEAGHLALEKPEVRKKINGNVLMNNAGASAGTEIVIHLWSFLVCKEIGIPSSIVFHPDGYKGDANWLIEQFENQNYIGRPLLEWMGIVNAANPIEVLKWVRS